MFIQNPAPEVTLPSDAVSETSSEVSDAISPVKGLPTVWDIPDPSQGVPTEMKGEDVTALTYAVRAQRKEDQMWGLVFDVNRAMILNIFPESVFGTWRGAANMAMGDVIKSIDGDANPAHFFGILQDKDSVEMEFQRIIVAEDAGQRTPFEAIIDREELVTKWGLVMDTTNGTVYSVTPNTPVAEWNERCLARARKRQQVVAGDKVLAINGIPIGEGGGPSRLMAERKQAALFILPKGFEELLPSRHVEF